MTISRIEFEFIKATLSGVLQGNPLPTFKSPEALQLVKACGRLARSNDTALLSALGAFALGRLIDLQGASAEAEREFAVLMPAIRKQ